MGETNFRFQLQPKLKNIYLAYSNLKGLVYHDLGIVQHSSAQLQLVSFLFSTPSDSKILRGALGCQTQNELQCKQRIITC